MSELFELGMRGRWKRPNDEEQGAGSWGDEKLKTENGYSNENPAQNLNSEI